MTSEKRFPPNSCVPSMSSVLTRASFKPKSEMEGGVVVRVGGSGGGRDAAPFVFGVSLQTEQETSVSVVTSREESACATRMLYVKYEYLQM